MSAENEKAKAEYSARMARRTERGETTTVVAEPRHYETTTKNHDHHHDENTVDNTPAGEMQAHSRVHKREELAAELDKGKREWQHRQSVNGGHTTTVNVGHYAQATEAGKHHGDASTAENTPASEQRKRMQTNGRKETAAELAKSKKAWYHQDHSLLFDCVVAHCAVQRASLVVCD
jgi:hypothetical protein